MISQSHENALVLEARNVHCKDSGIPVPIVKDPSSDKYVGYFENQFGEQWTVQIDRQAKTGILRGGDIGWEREVEIKNDTFEDLILSLEEFLWLSACWRAATVSVAQRCAWASRCSASSPIGATGP